MVKSEKDEQKWKVRDDESSGEQIVLGESIFILRL